MAEPADPPPDPIQAWMLRFPTGLRAGGASAEHEVLATYWTKAGTAPFALCRDGLLLDPGGLARFIPYVEIEEAGYRDFEMLMRSKRASPAAGSEPLTIRLESGEQIDLPVEVQGNMPDLLTIAHIIERRAFLFRRERERANQPG